MDLFTPVRWELRSEQQQAGSRQRRSNLLEHLQPLDEQVIDEERQSCDVSAGTGETGDQSQADEVSPRGRDDRDRRCRLPRGV